MDSIATGEEKSEFLLLLHSGTGRRVRGVYRDNKAPGTNLVY